MPSSRPSLRPKGTSLERAFYACALARGAEIYRNSFGSPYFFHRTRVSLVHEKEAHWFSRVIGVRLVAYGEETFERKHCLPMTAEAAKVVFSTNQPDDALHEDALFKELHKHSHYRFYGHLDGSGFSRQFNWAEVEKYYVTDPEGEVLLVLHRYPVDDIKK